MSIFKRKQPTPPNKFGTEEKVASSFLSLPENTVGEFPCSCKAHSEEHPCTNSVSVEGTCCTNCNRRCSWRGRHG